MYIMCVCLFSALSRRVGALQISIIIIIKNSLPAFVCVLGGGGGGGNVAYQDESSLVLISSCNFWVYIQVILLKTGQNCNMQGKNSKC